jgi:hypothetical protein
MTGRPVDSEALDDFGDDQRNLSPHRLLSALETIEPLDPLLSAVLRELRLRVYPSAPGSANSDYIVLDLHGVSIGVRRRPDALYVHLDTSETNDTMIAVEINGGGEHEHSAGYGLPR